MSEQNQNQPNLPHDPLPLEGAFEAILDSGALEQGLEPGRHFVAGEPSVQTKEARIHALQADQQAILDQLKSAEHRAGVDAGHHDTVLEGQVLKDRLHALQVELIGLRITAEGTFRA